jgi:hypothetical protein
VAKTREFAMLIVGCDAAALLAAGKKAERRM